MMKKTFLLAALLGTASLAVGQTGLNRFRLLSTVDGYIYIFHYTSTTHGAEVIQGFPYTHFANFHRIDGVYFPAYDKDRSTTETMTINIWPDKNGQPDIQSKPLYSIKDTTQKGTGAGWVGPYYHNFPKPYIIPPGTKNIWIGVHFGPDKGAKDYTMFAGLNRHGTGSLAGVLARKGVPNPGLAYHVIYKNGKPTTLSKSDWHWCWYPSILTKDPILRGYIKLNTDLKPHHGTNPITGKEQYGMGAMWPDINNAEGLPSPGRLDNIGWIVDQHDKVNKADTLTAFIFLHDKRLATPIPTPYGDWYLGFGGPWMALGALMSPLTNGTWKTPAVNIPLPARAVLAGTWLYSEAVVLETNSALKVVRIQLSNMCAMSL